MCIPQNKCVLPRAIFFFFALSILKLVSFVYEPQAILLLAKQPKKGV